MTEIIHTIPNRYLEEIANSPTKRHVGIVAGWLNRSHGDSTVNRRTIQNAVSAKKAELNANKDRGKI